ncbi:hypothetical protein CHS0354_021911 [Potamilus streckersoni]|uniref:TIR domain-containing protein n=1 Tax=Potamilus streckersoni TaxID=2493646 RepID=A0AAE0SJT3_9BIVA|nr:hypothetical protein CHS0354_021911 [Potamilus streckersoni]
MEDICFRWVGINSHFIGHVVTGLILLDKYVPNPPLDYILVDTINGMRLFQRKHIVKAGPDLILWKDILERKLPQAAFALDTEKVIFNMRAPVLPRGKKYHVVFLYGHETKEKTFSDNLIGELQGSMHKYICHKLQEEIYPSKGYLHGRLEAIKESAYTVIVLTNSILKGIFYHSELLTALENTRVLPLKIEDCSISKALQEVHMIDIDSKKYDWRKKLTAALRGHAPYLPFKKTDHIFFFHNDVDKKTVDAMIQRLEYPRFDLRVLSSGRDFKKDVSLRDNIKMCVEASAITVPVLSRVFVKKDWPAHEKDLAEYSPVIFPFILEKCETPDSLKGFMVFDSTRQTETWFNTWKETLINCLKSEKNNFT